MAGELLLINPRSRSRKRKGSKAARRRARRRNPVRAIRRNRMKKVRSRNPARAYRSRARRRRNPLSLRGMGGGVMGHATGALMGAGGAVLNDMLMTYLPLPLMLKQGPMAIASKAATAFAVGYLASFAVGKQRGAKLTEGALTVLAYQVVRPLVSTVLPLAGDDIEGLGYYSPGLILQDTLNPLTDLNSGTPLQSYISGDEGTNEGSMYDSSINAYIN